MRLIIDVLRDLIVCVKKDHDSNLHKDTIGWEAFQSCYHYHKNNETLHITYNYHGILIFLHLVTKNNLIIDECTIYDSNDKRYSIICDIDMYLNMTDEIKILLILEDETTILKKPFPFKEIL